MSWRKIQYATSTVPVPGLPDTPPAMFESAFQPPCRRACSSQGCRLKYALFSVCFPKLRVLVALFAGSLSWSVASKHPLSVAASLQRVLNLDGYQGRGARWPPNRERTERGGLQNKRKVCWVLCSSVLKAGGLSKPLVGATGRASAVETPKLKRIPTKRKAS